MVRRARPVGGVLGGHPRPPDAVRPVLRRLRGDRRACNIVIADKLAPSRYPTNPHPFVDRLHELFGRRLQLYRYLVAGVFAVLLALPASTQWQAWMLYRNAQSFGTSDAEFGVDVGFYVFELPFINFVLDWLFFAVIVVLMITLLVHVLNGGVMFASPIPTLSSGARGHLAVLLAVLAALKAADYWVHRYETTNERRGFVQGATYAVVHAQLPALLLLSVVALVTAALYLSTLRTESWRLPLISSAMWLVLAVLAGYIYPAAVQGLVVNPNQKAREAPFIERNVFATREAMGLTDTDVATVPISFKPLTAESIADDRPATARRRPTAQPRRVPEPVPDRRRRRGGVDDRRPRRRPLRPRRRWATGAGSRSPPVSSTSPACPTAAGRACT